MQSKDKTVPEYLASLPEDRRSALEAMRKVIKKHIDKSFVEGMQYGGLSYFLPHSRYPAGYLCDPKEPLPFAGIISQKNHIGLYLFCIYCSPEEEAAFRKDWLASGKKLDMGKSCVRVKKLEDVPLDVLARMLERVTARKFVAAYERALAVTAAGRKAAKKATKKKVVKKAAATAKNAAAKNTQARKTASKKASRRSR
jgi:hypothetical protein